MNFYIYFHLLYTLLLSVDCFMNESEFSELWLSSDLSLFPTLPIAVPWSNDKQCRSDSRKLILNLQNKTYWAMQMWDSSATAPFGILHGNRYQFGNYDECLEVNEPIRSQYCNVKVKATVHEPGADLGDPFDIDPDPGASVWKKFEDSRRDFSKNRRDVAYWGLCVPESCNASELENGINHYLNAKRLKKNETTYEVEVLEKYCLKAKEDDFTAGEIGFWTFCAVLILLVIISTSLDLKRTKNDMMKESKSMKILMSFSLKRNVNSLLNRDEVSSNYLNIIYGVRSYNTCYIVCDHRIGVLLASAVFNFQPLEKVFRSWENLILPHGDLFVDTFFFIGGLIATTILLQVFKRGFVNPIFVIIYRYVRLGPLYFFMVWFYASALARFGSGPVWNYALEKEIQYCQKNWWANILFIQNYVNAEEMCMIHAWYLASDLHFFIITIFLIMVVKKNEKIGLTLLYSITFISILAPGIVAYAYELRPIIVFYHDFLNKPRSDPSFVHLYIKSHTRATVYLFGVITAYFLHKNRNSTRKISYLTSVLGCQLGLLLLFAPMAYGSLYYDPRREYDIIESSIFASLRRTVWGAAWVVFMLINRYGTIPIVGQIFRWKIAVPLSKISYGIYLIHFIMQITDQAKAKIPQQFIQYDIFVLGTTDLFFSAGYALILYLILELPFRLIFKHLLDNKRKGKDPPPNVVTVKL